MMTIYSKEEVRKAALSYFSSDILAANVWMEKYALKLNGEFIEKTPDESINRYTDELYRIEQSYPNPISREDIYHLLKGYNYFILGGSPMFGLGNNQEISSLGNCFVAGNDEDSYGGIIAADEDLVQLMKRRGGVGLDLNHIRSKGSKVSNAASTSTGIVPFMDRYSNTTREVAQEGRRGALILTIGDDHEDVIDFITAKDDLTKVTGANISVRLSDDFMKLDTDRKRKVWTSLVHQAWKSAEPGVLFWDTILKESPADCYKEFKTVSTNPCQPSYATVLTPFGISTIGETNIGDIIWSEKGWTKVINKSYSGRKDVYKYSTSFGSVYCTKEHQIVENDKKVKAKDAKGINILRGEPTLHTKTNYKIEIMDGLVLGDGSVHKASNNLIYLFIGKNDQDYFSSVIKDNITKYRPGLGKNIAYEINTSLEVKDLPKTFLRKVPKKYFQANSTTVCNFLKGLYSANGSIISHRITLKTSSKILVEQVQQMLNSIGIASYITINKKHLVSFSNGKYECKESYDLNITRDKSIFYEKIGFLQKYKNDKLRILLEKKSYTLEERTKKLISTSFIEHTDVYDITVDNDTHTYWSGGHNISNCSELPLSRYDSCRLASLNIYAFVDHPFTKKAKFNFKLLERYVYLAQRMLDNLIDLENEKIDLIRSKIRSSDEIYIDRELELWTQIKYSLLQGRRTGLGLTGLADAGAALSLQYGSRSFIDWARKVQKTISGASYRSSIYMAEERGPFPEFELETESNHVFIQRILKEFSTEDRYKYEKFGRRNIANLTIAPTGSISILAGVSSGIEPVFMLAYDRRRKVTQDTPNAVKDQNGDYWLEYTVLHPKYQKFVALTGERDPNKSPYTRSTAHDVHPLSKLEVQAEMQKYIDHSISVTYNFPKNASEDEIEELFYAAWKKGCKGCTVYRDGCRDGVLISKEIERREDLLFNNAPKRPKTLPGEAFGTTVKGEKFTVIVGLYNNKPYEVFAYKGNSLSGIGEIVKLRKGVYSFRTDKEEFIITDSLADEQEAITRGYSMGLRHGSHIKFAVEQLSKTKGDLSSFTKAIARILKRFVEDGQTSAELCPDCNHRLVYESGCLTCKNCGHSKCS